MVEFTAKIAGYAMAVRALYPETKELFRDYLTEEQPFAAIESGEVLIQKERRLLKKTDAANRRQTDGFSDRQIESNFLYREVAERLSPHGVVLMHGSAVAVDGEAYIFVAPSGTGKSTHTRLWREVFGERAVMINDDKPLLKCTDEGILVCGSPWNGKHQLGSNISVPLKAVCFLARGKENRIEPINAADAFLPMLKSVYHSEAAEKEACILRSLQCVRQRTEFYRLECTMEQAAAIAAYEGMNSERNSGGAIQ